MGSPVARAAELDSTRTRISKMDARTVERDSTKTKTREAVAKTVEGGSIKTKTGEAVAKTVERELIRIKMVKLIAKLAIEVTTRIRVAQALASPVQKAGQNPDMVLQAVNLNAHVVITALQAALTTRLKCVDVMKNQTSTAPKVLKREFKLPMAIRELQYRITPKDIALSRNAQMVLNVKRE